MSKKIPVRQWLDIFEKMYKEHWSYVYGGAKEGAVDCSGAFVYAAQTLGKIRIGQHSSNYIARHNIVEMLPISEAKPGYAVFRHSSKFDTDDLARKYGDGLGNFRHIGTVSKDGKHVWHAQGSQTGFVETKLNSSWYCCGKLDFVDYDSEESVMPNQENMLFIVNVQPDSWLNVRESPRTSSKRLGKLIFGDTVEVVDTKDKWSKIVYGDSFGWVYSKYIEELHASVENVTPDEEEFEVQVVITDSAGNVFRPVGDFTTSFELMLVTGESID